MCGCGWVGWDVLRWWGHDVQRDTTGRGEENMSIQMIMGQTPEMKIIYAGHGCATRQQAGERERESDRRR